MGRKVSEPTQLSEARAKKPMGLEKRGKLPRFPTPVTLQSTSAPLTQGRQESHSSYTQAGSFSSDNLSP